MSDVIDQNKWGGVCGFVSVLHGLWSRGSIAGLDKDLDKGDLEKQLGAEMITYLKMTQVERPKIANEIITFTKTWGGAYANVTMNSIIQKIKDTALSKEKNKTWDERSDIGCALPPNAAEDYLKHVDLKFKRTLDGTRFPFTQEQMGKYRDCLVGTGATSKADNGYNGLRHWVYVNKAGTMLNWAEETKMGNSVEAPYDVTNLSVKHNCIVYAIQLL